MVVRKTQPLPIECVVRGYVSGSGWKDYRVTGKICGIDLPNGLVESDRLPEPIFTPATKAATGHDENISFDEAAKLIGRELAEKVREVSLTIYKRAARIRRAARRHPRRHEIRIRPAEKFRRRRRTHLDRRSAHAGFFALLARGALRTGRTAALLRQAIRARLSRAYSMVQDAAGAGAAARNRRTHQRKVSRSVSRPDRTRSRLIRFGPDLEMMHSRSAQGAARFSGAWRREGSIGRVSQPDGGTRHTFRRSRRRIRKAVYQARAGSSRRKSVARCAHAGDSSEHAQPEAVGI